MSTLPPPSPRGKISANDHEYWYIVKKKRNPVDETLKN